MNTHTMENVEDIYPLSPIQQGMLFHSLHGSQADVYFQQFVFTFDAPLTADTFRRAWQDTLERHTILRTAFLWEGLDEPLQLVFRQVTLPFAQHDWRQLTADEQQAQLEAYLEADRQRGFDLSAPPLLRVTMIRLATAHYHVIWSHHHILLDGWSVPLIIQEVFGRYEALLAERVFLPAPAHPFREYIAWLQERDLGQAEAFWRQALQGLDAPTPLGLGHTVRTYAPIEHYDQRDLRLPAATTEQLRAFARRERLTLNTLVQGAWALLLSRYSGQDDVLFGVTVSGRALPLPAIETMIGIFINTLPLRVRSAPDVRLVPWLQAIQAQQLERYAYTPLVQIQAWSEIAPPTPLFESIVVFENFPADQLYDQQRRSAINNFHAVERTNYPLALGAEPGSELVLSLTYDAQRFAPAAIERLLRHLQALLDEMIADPSRRLADLSLLLADERRLLLYDWNATQTDYPQETSIHALVAAQVARTPDAVAVVFGGQGSGVRGQGAAVQTPNHTLHAPTNDQRPTTNDRSPLHPFTPSPLQQLTYHELHVRANRLAHHLQTLGVGPEVRVGVCLERSPELMIALLGVLNAGGAYVPLDPTYPDARLAFIIDDARVAVILTRRVLARANWGAAEHGAQPPRPAAASPVTLCLDVEWPSIQQQRDVDRRPPPVEADNPAYVIYTSGSLGRPKGVVVPHRALVNYTLAAAESFAMTAADRVLQFASINFDASAEEIYPSLISGATLVLRSDAMLETGAIFLRSCWAWEISVLDLPMSYWHEVVAALAEGSATLSSRVRLVIIGGEKALPERLALWWQHVSTSVQLINTYGPTEATIVATAQELTRLDAGEPAEHEIPIGRPVANVQAYVLDRHMRLAPIGVPGELYLGGTCLSRGYLDRPDLTAERFVPNPFGGVLGDGCWVTGAESSNTQHPTPNTRLYKTGDLVRYQSDGALEFLGRIDDQVKLRGFRIELGEIAAVLRMHPDVRDAVVVMREERPGEKRLVAYVVPTNDERRTTNDERASTPASSSVLSPQSSVLRAFLAERLPDYMVPSAFMLLEALPLTPSHKLDRRALPAPTQQTEEAIAPRTPTEQLIAGIWATILHLPQVSLNDNFFELGGHSLLAAQLTSRLREIFQIDLPLRRLFDAPTLQQLAAGVDEARRGAARPVAPPLVPVAREGAMPLSLAQQRLWFLQQLVPDDPFYNIPVPLLLTGALDLHCLRRSLNEIIRRHEGLRTCFPAVNGQASQQILPELRLTLPVTDLGGLPPDERTVMTRQFASQDAHRLFDLARGPLLRASILRLSGAEHILLLNVHHIVFDGWSVGVLIQELQALYGAYLAGRPSPLPELAIQYADFAHWQRTWLQGDVLDAQINYWRQQLDGAPALLALPADHPRPAVHTFRGNSLSATLAAELTHALHQLSQQEGVTLFMTLLAAFQVLLFRYTGQTDILVGSGTANRNRPEVEPLIGFFVSTLVMRTDLSGNPDFRALLSRVREVALDAYAHQDVPFDKVVEELQPERALSYSPIFQVALVYQNFPTLSLSLPGLELDVVEIEHTSAKFDMTLFVTDSADGLFLTLECNADLFERPTIQRMLDHFQIVLAGVGADPDQPIANLPLLTAAERDALATWNQTRRPDLQTGCIHELFSAQAARTPDTVAIVFDGSQPGVRGQGSGVRSQESGVRSQESEFLAPNPQSPIPNPQFAALSPRSSVLSPEQLTYAALDRRANQLAQLLRAHGIGPEALVGVCLPRSADLIVAFLGVLKAGGAYVPLDPAYPRARLTFILGDARPTAVLTHQALLDTLPPDPTPRLCLDRDQDRIAAQAPTAPAAGTTPDSMAYVIYTSGSTGTPKGVAVAHRGIANLAQAQATAFGLSPDSRVLQFASFNFDASVSEIFVTLLAGATLCIASQSALLPGPGLTELLRDQRITCVTLTPSTLAATTPAALPDLAVLVAAGEKCSAEVVTRWASGRRFLNAYGPTEASVCATIHTAVVAERAAVIGRPLANTQVYLLDPHMQPVPIGVVGELHLGGVGLARGYLGRPDLTAERFIPNPFAGVLGDGCWVLEDSAPVTQHPSPNTRLYKTGDLARWRPDGTLEFIGRADQQLKLRGYRIEPGEIAAVLAQHPAVRESLVIARAADDPPTDLHLVAYVVPDLDQLPQLEAQEEQPAWQEQQIDHWQTVFEDIYTLDTASADPLFNITGWNSSFTGRPIPAAEMRDWVEQTVARILALRPRRVLEIGCGTGLLLFRIAPHVAHYCATDFSPRALDSVRAGLDAMGMRLAHVTLVQQTADQIGMIADGPFDVVVINSVVQYFPNIAYLQQVLEQAVELVGPGGAIFVGDVRSLPALEVFHTAVQLQRASGMLPCAQLRRIVQRQVAQEEELVVAPAFFQHLPQWLPRITRVTTQLKRASAVNELSMFRYDIILHVEAAYARPAQYRRIDWDQEQLTLADLHTLLAERTAETVVLTQVPNARLLGEARAHALLCDPDGPPTAGELRYAVGQPHQGIDPNAFWALGEELGYFVEVRWSEAAPEYVDVVFATRAGSWLPPIPPAPPAALNTYANNPLQTRAQRLLVPALLQFLQARLPAYMVPRALVLLDAVPQTPHGKIDYQALPAADGRHTRGQETFVAPRTPSEIRLAAIWEDVLNIHPIGVRDNFFEFGGHSLLTVRLMAAIREEFGRDLPLATLFTHPTIAQLAELLSQESGFLPDSILVGIQREGTRPPFFCVHPAGGNVICYHQLAHYLGTDQPFYALQDPGLHNERAALATVEDLAALYIDELRTVQPAGPYRMGGWSFGGVVAFEMAHQLRATGHEVHVLLFDAPAPVPENQPVDPDDAALLAAIIGEIGRSMGHELQIDAAHLRRYARDEQLRLVLEHLQQAQIVSDMDALHDLLGYAARYTTVYKANMEAQRRYVPALSQHPLTLFRASETELDYITAHPLFAEAGLGWDQLINGEIEIRFVPGGHHTLMYEPYVQTLAEQVANCLAQLDLLVLDSH